MRMAPVGRLRNSLVKTLRMGGIAIAITAETGSGVAMPSDEVIAAVAETATALVEEKPDELETLAESQDGLK